MSEEGASAGTPVGEIARRIIALQESLAERGLDGALILQNADLYYFAGTVQQGFLFVPTKGHPTLFVRRVLERARAESPLTDVCPLPSLRRLPLELAERHGTVARLGLELDVLPVAYLRRIEELLPATEAIDISDAVLRQRAVKSAYEVKLQRRSAAIADGVCTLVPDLLREGLTEAAFAGRVEAEARALGHEGVIRMRGFNQEMFYGQLITGTNSAVPSFLDTPLGGAGLSPAVAQGVSMRRIGRGEPVVFDFVAVSDGYVTDFTRMFSLGPLPGELRAAYEVALAVQAAVVRLALPGVPCRALYEAALDVVRAAGLEERFMGSGGTRVRFVGHGVGLELDELPVISANERSLAEGMVFALEPKFVFDGLGAVGVENTWHMTAHGLERLHSSDDELRELP